MRQKTFGKWLAAAGILIVMTIWMVLPALAAPTVNSIRITFKDKYEDPGVIEEPEIRFFPPAEESSPPATVQSPARSPVRR